MSYTKNLLHLPKYIRYKKWNDTLKLENVCIRHLCSKINVKENDDDEKSNSKVGINVTSKFEVFEDEKSPIIFDVEHEREKYEITDESEQQKRRIRSLEGISPKRGERGVLDIHELVDILRKEKLRDIAVIKVPASLSYVDYIVIGEGRSGRHMNAVAETVSKAYKYKKNVHERFALWEDRKSSKWQAIDLGNIALHIFSKSTREMYDLESLWSVGPEFDSKYVKQQGSAEIPDYKSLLAKLTPVS